MPDIDESEQAVDRAYAEASRMLESDALDRSRRRAGVLAAVRQTSHAQSKRVPLSVGRGWMAAAAVAGLSVVAVLVTRVENEEGSRQADAMDSVVVARGPEVSAVPQAKRQEREARAEEGNVAPASKPEPVRDVPSAPAVSIEPQQAPSAGPATGNVVAGAERSGQAAGKPEAAAPAVSMAGEQQSRAGQGADSVPWKARSGMRSEPSAALSEASASGNEVWVRKLVDAGAVLEERDRDGDTALLKAVRNGHYRVAEILVREGADRTAKGRDGRSAEDIGGASEDARMRSVFSR